MRITRDVMFMEMAHVVAKRATCFRGNVGAIVVHDHNVVSIGYNGPPSGEDHCYGNDCPLHNGGCTRSTHAEINALRRAGGRVRVYDDLELFCTHCPCPNCAEEIVWHGVKRVVFTTPYRLTGGLERMLSSGIRVHKLTPAGYLIDMSSGALI